MRVLIILFLAAAVSLATSCRDRDEKKPSAKPKPKPIVREAHDPSKEVEALTGAHTRLVWTECIKPGDSDTFATGNNLVLEGLDTRDGLGTRLILSKPGNYARPLLTCDGTGIIFSDKNTVRKGTKKHYAPVIYLTGWKGGKPIRLAEGYAVDCWRDPATGVEWVIAVQDIRPTKSVAIDAQRIVRFPLNAPEKVETVYDDTPISADNLQFSRDGTEACGLFPWPHAGILSRSADGKWKAQQFAIGCWTSHSPDNSGVVWAFDGNHKKVHMHAGDGVGTWEIVLSDAPGVKGRELYHPRWSNHPRFLVTTGPYSKQKGSSGSVITRGGATSQVLLARLSPTADKIEGWVQITNDKAGESYPAAWIEGGDQANLEGHSLTRQQPLAAAEAWPSLPEGLLFLWRNRLSMNSFTQRDGRKREAGVDSYDAARFGRFQEMQIDGGYCRIETEGAEDILAHLREKPDAAFEALLLPPETATHEDADAAAPQTLFTAPGFVIRVEAGKLVLARPSGKIWDSTEPLPALPCHLVVNRRTGASPEFEAFANGKPLTLAARSGTFIAPPAETIDFGGGWNGGLLHVAIYDRALAASEISRNAVVMKERIAALPPPPARVRLQGRLVELSAMPTPEDISPYTRSLVEYVYEVEKVLEGEFKESRVLVKHWAMLALLPARGFPREMGKSYELLIERGEDHQHLQGERVMQDTTAFDLPPWFDVSPPRVAEQEK